MASPIMAPSPVGQLSVEGLHDFLRLTGLAFEAGSQTGLTFGTSEPYEAGLVVLDIIEARLILAQVSGSQNK